MHPLALTEAYWQKLLKEQVLCADLITKEVKRWQLWQNEAILCGAVAGGVGEHVWERSSVAVLLLKCERKIVYPGDIYCNAVFHSSFYKGWIRSSSCSAAKGRPSPQGVCLTRLLQCLVAKAVNAGSKSYAGIKINSKQISEGSHAFEGFFCRTSGWPLTIFYWLFLERVGPADNMLGFAEKGLVHTNSC